MSTVAVADLAAPSAGESGSGSEAGGRGRVIGRIRRIGFVVLALQFVGLLVWSTVLAGRFALSWDMAAYHQAWWLIGHGDLDPYSTVVGLPFWQNHGEFLLWPLAVLVRLWPHPITLLWVQDVAVVGAEAVAFTWLCDVASAGRRRLDPRLTGLLAPVGLILLVADPWIYWTVSFDFHVTVIGFLFVVLAARDLHRNPDGRRVWLWVALALACGVVVATYLVAIGLSAVVAGSRWRRRGLLIAVVAVVWVVLLSAVGADAGSPLGVNYGYLAVGAGHAVLVEAGPAQLVGGVVHHPGNVARVLWDRRLDVYAILGSGGLFGILWPWVAVTFVLVLLENGLNANVGFFVPGFQDALLFVLLPVGTVAVLAIVARRHARIAAVAALVLAANALAWGAVWTPRTSTQWLRVSPGAAKVLASVNGRIPPGDQVVVSQGVAGPFSGRRWVYAILQPGAIPVHTTPVWVVVAPRQGIETVPVKVSDALVAELAGPLHATLVAHGSGVWAFRWTPSAGTRSLQVPQSVPTVAAWTATGAAGTAATAGPSANWRAESNGKRGYVVEGDYWQATLGRYRATVVLSSTAPVEVEVWDATGSQLLGRRNLPPTNGSVAVTMPVDLARLYPANVYSGISPFSIQPAPPPPGNQLEIRVWTPGGGFVSISSLELVPAVRSAGSLGSS